MADKVSIEIEVRKIGEGLKQVQDELKALTGQVKAEGAKIQTETKNLSQGFAGIGSSIRGIKALLPAGLAGLLGIAGLTRVVTDIFNTAVAFETLQFQLRAVSKTIDEADEEFKMIREFAARTPFTTQAVTQAFIQLKAVGLAPTRREMEIFGDTAFAMGRDITDVAQSIIALETEVLRRLGIQIDRTGKKAIIISGDIRREVENDLAEIRKALIEVWEKRFPDAMEQAANTTRGALAILRSEMDELKDVIGKQFLPQVQAVSMDTAKWSNRLRENADELSIWKDAVLDALNPLKLFQMIWDKLVHGKSSFADRWRTVEFEKLMDPLIKDIETVTDKTKGGAAALKKMMAELDEVTKRHIDAQKRLGEQMAEQLKAEQMLRDLEREDEEARIKKIDEEFNKRRESWQAQQKWLEEYTLAMMKLDEINEEVTSKMSQVWKDFTEDLRWSLEAGFFDLFKGGIKDLEDAFNQFVNNIYESFMRALSKMITEWLLFGEIGGTIEGGGGILGAIGKLLKFQHGGLIMEPVWGVGRSGQRYLFGEAGPELVTPAYAAIARPTNITVQIENETGMPLKVDQARVDFDAAERMIIRTVIKSYYERGPIYRTFKGGS